MFAYDDLFVLVVVVSAFMALHLENATHAAISFAVALTAISALYFDLNAPFAAIFQLVVGAGTIAIFFLASEMFAQKGGKMQSLGSKVVGAILAIGISIPSIVLDIGNIAFVKSNGLSFSSALWESRAIDVIGQGVVILTLAIGAVMVLKKSRKEG